MNLASLTFYALLYAIFTIELDSVIYFSTLLSLTILFQWVYIVRVINEMAFILNIKVFTVKKKRNLESVINDPLLETED